MKGRAIPAPDTGPPCGARRNPRSDGSPYLRRGCSSSYGARASSGRNTACPMREPLTFLAIRMLAVVALLAVIVALGRRGPSGAVIGHNVVAGLLVHGCYLGGVFIGDRPRPADRACRPHRQPAAGADLDGREPPARRARDAARNGPGSCSAWSGSISWSTASSPAATPAGSPGPPSRWRCSASPPARSTRSGSAAASTGGRSFLIQYVAAGLLFGLGALLFETRAVQWTAQFVFALAWLVLRDVVRRHLAVLFPDPAHRDDALTSLLYLMPPVTALMGWAAVRRAPRRALARRHGGLRRRGVPGEPPADRIAPKSQSAGRR